MSAESTTTAAAGWHGSGVGGFSQSAAISGLSITSRYSGLSGGASGPLLPCGDLVFAEGVGIRHMGIEYYSNLLSTGLGDVGEYLLADARGGHGFMKFRPVLGSGLGRAGSVAGRIKGIKDIGIPNHSSKAE